VRTTSSPQWDPKNPVAPFDGDGNLMHYPEAWGALQWLPAEPFSANLSLVDYARGRSAAYFLWKGDDGKTYPMFLKDFVDAVFLLELHHGATERRRWRFVKRGQNYGIALDD
jgi:hypothetical protein